MQSSLNISNKENLKEFFAEYGYAGAFNLPASTTTDRDLCAAVKSSDKLANGLIDKILERLFFARKHHIFYRLPFEMSIELCILEDVSTLLGPNLLLWITEFRSRKPNNKGQGWHRDEANFLVDGVHVSVAVSDMNLNNGCLQVIPKTHKYGLSNKDLAKRAKNGECDLDDAESMARLADRLYPENAPHQVVSLEMKAGQYLFTKGGLWHGVTPNRANQSRITCLARYTRPDTEIPSRLKKRLAFILVQGEVNDRNRILYAPPRKAMRNNLLLNSIINAFSPRNFMLGYKTFINGIKKMNFS